MVEDEDQFIQALHSLLPRDLLEKYAGSPFLVHSLGHPQRDADPSRRD